MKQSTKYGIDQYVRVGQPVGDFLTAVLSNNLKEAFMYADEDNRVDLFEIVGYCYNEIPSSCWGSSGKVEAWLEKWDLVRDEADAREVTP